MYIPTTEPEMERLKIAQEIKKYGHLESWKELFLFQMYVGTKEQIQEIAIWARRKFKRGERVTLPLKDYGKQITL